MNKHSVVIQGMELPKDGRPHKILMCLEPDGTCRAVVETAKDYADRSIETYKAVEMRGELVFCGECRMWTPPPDGLPLGECDEYERACGKLYFCRSGRRKEDNNGPDSE